jgi:UMF1 family MFS transporter
MLVVLPFVTGSLFGINVPLITGGGKAASFLPTAALFMAFSIPMFLWVKERPVTQTVKTGLAGAYRDVWDGLKQTDKYPGVLRFLIADYFFEDAVTTVILNIGLYCSLVVGFTEGEISAFLIISTLSAVIGSYIIGLVATRMSLKKLLNGIVWGWVICLAVFLITDNRAVIWALGSVVGVLLGGLWTTSRPMLAELVPRQELGRFFGLFSLSGRAAAIVGPLIWTLAVYLFNSERPLGQWFAATFDLETASIDKLPYKMGVATLALMMLVGLILFRKVPETRRPADG